MKYKKACMALICVSAMALSAMAKEDPATGGAELAKTEPVRLAAQAAAPDKEAKPAGEKTAAKAKEENVAANGKTLTKEEIGGLFIPVISPLQNLDFHIGGIHRGDSLDVVKHTYGTANKYSQSAHYTTMQYANKDVTMRVRSRNDTADILKVGGEERKAVRVGIDAVFLSAGQHVPIGRGLHLKVPAEVLVRQMGIPANVLRDTDANVYYFVYTCPDKDTSFVFAVANRRIERVALMEPRPPYVAEGAKQPVQNKWGERDFTLMGFALDKPFQANKYNMWSNLVKKDGNDFWLYGDYGVEVDRRNVVRKVFLLTNNAYTSRGATLGYHLSTVLSLYGRPDRMEIGPADAEKSVDAYYYDSPFQKGVSLAFIVNHKTQYVEDILLISAPIQNLQDPMARYGLK